MFVALPSYVWDGDGMEGNDWFWSMVWSDTPQVPQLCAAVWSRKLVSLATEDSKWHCALSKET